MLVAVLLELLILLLLLSLLLLDLLLDLLLLNLLLLGLLLLSLLLLGLLLLLHRTAVSRHIGCHIQSLLSCLLCLLQSTSSDSGSCSRARSLFFCTLSSPQ